MFPFFAEHRAVLSFLHSKVPTEMPTSPAESPQDPTEASDDGEFFMVSSGFVQKNITYQTKHGKFHIYIYTYIYICMCIIYVQYVYNTCIIYVK